MERWISYGGGVQSNALLALAALGRLETDGFIFANVGHDSEKESTLQYVENEAKPFAEKHGIKFVEVHKTTRKKPETLIEKLNRSERSIDIPMYLKSGMPGNRSCTVHFKIKPIARYLRSIGASEENPFMLGIGISMDEVHRAKDSREKGIKHFWPLLDLTLRRVELYPIIEEAGLPIPDKSACWFCPFQNSKDWDRVRKNQPETFQKCIDLEKMLNERRLNLGRDEMYLHYRCKPLEEATTIQHDQLELFDGCGGYCML